MYRVVSQAERAKVADKYEKCLRSIQRAMNRYWKDQEVTATQVIDETLTKIEKAFKP